ncbi:hypothetical protein MNBD_GAMMA23-233 [hydrothermal vent metagenome]|uniref:Cyclic nucleotide-binding domain-containing protein n=1 Tax=hydrothermal vent metagenome TaxID=652676 RepID=A0A3B1AE79_9ZZZZ
MAILNKYLNNKFLKTLEPLSKLSADKLSELANKSNIEVIPAGRTLFRQNEKDKRSYYLVSGQIELHTNGAKQVQTIKAKTPEAKYPLAQQVPRPCTAKAKINSELISIDTDLLEMLIESDGNPSGNYEVTEISSDDENGWMLKFLQSRAFLQIPTENIQKILMSMEEIVAKKGQTIVSQGESNDYYYIVKTGKCSVSRRPSPKAEDVQIAILAAGDGFGEEALIIDGVRNATVRMMDAGSLMRLTKDDFISLLVSPLLDYIHLEELKSRVNSGDLLIDVRPHKNFMDGHLDGAINTPLSMIRLKINNFSAERNTIVYCDDASRSTAAAFLLIQHGLSCSILKNGINDTATAKEKNQASNTSMSNIIANLNAVTNKEKAKVFPIPHEAKKAKQPTLNKANTPPDAAHKKAIAEKQKLEGEKQRLQQEAKILREKAKTEKLANDRELQKLENEAKKHKQAVNDARQQAKREAQALREKAEAAKIIAERKLQEQAAEAKKHQLALKAKQQAERKAQTLREKAETEKLAAERALQEQAAEAKKHQLALKAKQQAEREAQTLREKAETEKLAAERALQEQKEYLDTQLKKQQQLTEESKQKIKQETAKIRQQADEELSELRNELQKTRNSVEQRVKALKEKEKQRAEEEIKSRQQHANEAIKNSIEQARQQAAADAEQIRQQALNEAQKLQQEIELKRQQLETEAERIRLDAERDRAATLELARQQAQDIVLRTSKEAEYISAQRQELDSQTEQIRLQTEAERHATLHAAKEEALNIVRKTAEEAQQIDLQRQRIEEEVSLIKSEAARAKEQTLELAKQEAIKIRMQAEKTAQQQALEKVKHVRRKTLQQAEELKKQRSTMEFNLKQAEEIRLQAEKEAVQIRNEALQSATSHAEEIIIEDIQRKTQPALSSKSYSDIVIPGQTTPMAESDAKSLAQEIVFKLEKAESNRIKDQIETTHNTSLSLSSASLKRRSDGRIILEGEEDIFIFKEPETLSKDELSKLEASIDEAIAEKNTHSVSTLPTKKSVTNIELPEFTIEEPDFDLVDELPSHLGNQKAIDDAISGFSDFELHQPSDIRPASQSNSKRPAQRIIAIAASLFVAIGVGITFLGVNSEQTDSTSTAMQEGNSFNATRVSGLATNNMEIDKKVINDAEHEFEKLLSKWKKSKQQQIEQATTAATERIESLIPPPPTQE